MNKLFALSIVILIGCNPASREINNAKQNAEPISHSTKRYSIPHFADSSTFIKLQPLTPIVDKIYQDYATKNNLDQKNKQSTKHLLKIMKSS